MFQLLSVASCPIAWYHRAELGSILLTWSFQIAYRHWWGTLSVVSSGDWADPITQPFLTKEMLQSLISLWGIHRASTASACQLLTFVHLKIVRNQQWVRGHYSLWTCILLSWWLKVSTKVQAKFFFGLFNHLLLLSPSLGNLWCHSPLLLTCLMDLWCHLVLTCPPRGFSS